MNLDAYFGVQKAAKQLKMLNAQQFGDMLWQAMKNDGKTPSHDVYGNAEDPKRKEINMIFENSVIRISNFFSNPSNSFKEGFARKIKSTAPTSSKCIYALSG